MGVITFTMRRIWFSRVGCYVATVPVGEQIGYGVRLDLDLGAGRHGVRLDHGPPYSINSVSLIPSHVIYYNIAPSAVH